MLKSNIETTALKTESNPVSPRLITGSHPYILETSIAPTPEKKFMTGVIMRGARKVHAVRIAF